jgi:hypothetical protein
MQLEERKLGDYVVKELTLGQILDLRDEHPEGGNKLTLAMLGASVCNGTGQPIGIEGARSLPGRFAGKLSALVAELTGDRSDEGEEKNG